MWTRGELKERGMAAFKANYWKCVLVAFVLLLISGGLSSSSSYRSGGNFSEMMEKFRDRTESSKEEIENIKDLEDKIGPEIVDEIKEEKHGKSKAPDVGVIIMVVAVVMIFVAIAIVIGFVIGAFLLNPIEVGCSRFFKGADISDSFSTFAVGRYLAGSVLGGIIGIVTSIFPEPIRLPVRAYISSKISEY